MDEVVKLHCIMYEINILVYIIGNSGTYENRTQDHRSAGQRTTSYATGSVLICRSVVLSSNLIYARIYMPHLWHYLVDIISKKIRLFLCMLSLF